MTGNGRSTQRFHDHWARHLQPHSNTDRFSNADASSYSDPTSGGNSNSNTNGKPGRYANSNRNAYSVANASIPSDQPLDPDVSSDRRQCWNWRVHYHGQHAKTCPHSGDWTIGEPLVYPSLATPCSNCTVLTHCHHKRQLERIRLQRALIESTGIRHQRSRSD